MAKIRIDTNVIRQANSAFSTQSSSSLSQVCSAANRASSVSSPVYGVASGLSSGLATTRYSLGELERDCRKLVVRVEEMCAEYEAIERQLPNLFENHRAHATAVVGGSSNSKSGSWSGSVASGSVSRTIGGVVGTASGSVLGYEAGKKGELTLDKDKVKGVIGAKGEVWGAKGEVELSDGKDTIKASGKVLDAKGSADAYLEISPENLAVGVEAGVAGSVLSGSIEAQKGVDNFNSHVSASGELLSGEAKAHAGIDKNGFNAGAKAEVCAAKGSVSGGVTIFGIKIDTEVEGKAGALGGEVGGAATKSSVEADVGLAAMLGVEVKVKVDWSKADFSLPSYSDINKWLF